MSCNECACGMWTNKVFYAAAKLSSIEEDLQKCALGFDTRSMAAVLLEVKDLRNELLSVLASQAPASTTGLPMSGKTK